MSTPKPLNETPMEARIPARAWVQAFFFVVVIPFLPLLISGRWGWWEAWVYAILSILGFVISRALAARRHPDLLAERARFLQHKDAEPWDRTLAPLVGLGGALIPLAAGVEARVGTLAEFSLTAKILSLGVLLAGYALGSYALLANRFFSGMVRIQTERGHRVVSSGPYRWVRHPGYAGGPLSFLASPILLGAMWTFLPAVFWTIVTVIRTALEDRALQEKLEGYRDYAGRVRYRLVPGVW